MERTLSRLDLLNKKVNSTPSNWLSALWQVVKPSTMVLLTLYIPKTEYYRGQVLVSDVKDTAQKNLDFVVEDIIALLYIQFLHQIMSGETDLPAISRKLLTLIENLYQEKELEFKSENRLTLQKSNKKKSWLPIEVRIKEKYVYRGEWLLADIEQFSQDLENYSLEDIIVALYFDFIRSIRKGHSEKLVQDMILSVENADL